MGKRLSGTIPRRGFQGHGQLDDLAWVKPQRPPHVLRLAQSYWWQDKEGVTPCVIRQFIAWIDVRLNLMTEAFAVGGTASSESIRSLESMLCASARSFSYDPAIYRTTWRIVSLQEAHSSGGRATIPAQACFSTAVPPHVSQVMKVCGPCTVHSFYLSVSIRSY